MNDAMPELRPLETRGQNQHIRDIGGFLARVPDCETATDIIVNECAPNRLNCARCERNPANREG